jgi:hypothetical protein
VPPLFGLASETGNILNIYKKILRDSVDRDYATSYLRQEVGDLLWYLAIVAEAHGLSLEEIAQANLERARNRYPIGSDSEALSTLPVFDRGFPTHEQFPRFVTMEFAERSQPSSKPLVSIRLVEARPNAFTDGPRMIQTPWGETKEIGFRVGSLLGDPLNDNTSTPDGYRYHDAIHMGFMAVLGWSPGMRGLLQVKRRSNPEVDENEDGARALFLEEGLTAILAELAKSRLDFQSELSVNTEVLAVVRAAIRGLEVKDLPDWIWARAITQGFRVFKQLSKNRGGFVVADLEGRTLTYTPLSPIS